VIEVYPLPKDFPREDVDVYRVVHSGDKYFLRIDFNNSPNYITTDNQKIIFHSEFLASLAKDVEECSVTEIMREVIYGILYEFGSKRIELHKRIEDLFQKMAEGKITDTSDIISIHFSIITLYSDSSSLYYVVKKLSKFLDKEVEEDCLFAYD